MMGSREKIPDKVLREIFPKKLKRSLASERVYSHVKKMITSHKSKKGQRLIREEIAQNLNLSETAVSIAFSKLKKDKLVISKGGAGSFVA
jgi:DNA-binding GntR family transcriptional regulator